MSHKLLNVLAIALGNLLVALAVTLFIVPHGLVLGGSTGMALVITHLAPLPLSLVVLAINGALFLLGRSSSVAGSPRRPSSARLPTRSPCPCSRPSP